MKSNKLTFQNKDGITLSARLDLPVDEKPKAFAIFAHCFTCNKDFHAVKNISQALTSNGIGVLLFDFTGLGKSEGKLEYTTFTSNIEDLMAASAYMEENYEAPKIMIGHSLGGTAALFASHRLENIKAVVTIASPFEPKHVSHLLADSIDEIKSKGKAEVQIGGRPFTLSNSFLKDLENYNAEKIAKELKKALLIMHSPQDKIVNIDNAAKIYAAATHPKSFISLDGADHLLQNKVDSSYAGQMIATWVRKYIDMSNKKSDLKSDFDVAAQTNDESYVTEILAGGHRFIADEPEDVGGTDLGPNPHQLLSAALAACSTMTMQMYAKRKEWPLKNATAHVQHKKVDREIDGKTTKVDHFNRLVELKGDLTEEQRQRIFEIANKCPVKRTLSSDIEIESSLQS